MKHADLDRVCRLNGKSPTARERWTAFYRLWRISKADDPRSDAQDCFRVLMYDWRWIRLLDAPGDYYASLRFMPIRMRRINVGLDKSLDLSKA